MILKLIGFKYDNDMMMLLINLKPGTNDDILRVEDSLNTIKYKYFCLITEKGPSIAQFHELNKVIICSYEL